MNQYIEEAIHDLRTRGSAYAKPERYYRGSHDLAFATEKFANAFGSLFREFAMNLCPAVCDAIRDKLRITGFQSSGPWDAILGEIWKRNRMQLRTGEVHREAIVAGDAYVIVWPDDLGRPAIYPNRAASVSVVYDEDRPGQIIRSAKFWRSAGKRTRLNIFFPDRVERYISAGTTEAPLPEPDDFVPFKTESRHITANPYGVVPVFHFGNNADIGAFGRSELESAIPVQDGLNKSVLDMLVAMEFSAFRQRWAAGIELSEDAEGGLVTPFKSGADRLWITQNPEAKFGDFGTTNLDGFLKVKDSFRIDMASVTGTPMYYLLPHTRGFPSGEAIMRAESRFIAKVRDRQTAFGETWSDVMQFAARIAGHRDLLIDTKWEDPSQSSERERLEAILLKKQIGISTEQALREAGY